MQELGLPRDLSRTPLVSVIFNMDKVAAPIDFGELTVDGIETPKAFYNFDLGLNAIDDGERIVVECDFNTDLFDGTTVARWLEQYRLLLEQVTAEPAAELAAATSVASMILTLDETLTKN